MKISIKGIKEKDFVIDEKDSLAMKLSMLIEGHCTIGVKEALKKYGYTEQRYYQLLAKYQQDGAQGLIDKKTGSDKQPVRTKDVFQMGYKVSKRSVERTITEYGLQKKRMS